MGEAERVELPEQPTTPRAPRRRRRRRSDRRESSRRTRGRIRAVYFSMAAIWGFLAGTGAVLIALSSLGRTVRLGSTGVVLVVVAAVLSLLGGLVMAVAYRAASRRIR